MGKNELESLREQLSLLQRECKSLKIPIMIVFEGMSAAGKGRMIHSIISPMDPRGFIVHTSRSWTKEERKYFYMRKYWLLTPEDGNIAIFDQSWYSKILLNWNKKGVIDKYCDELNIFERQLTDGGMAICKIFLTISKKEQTKRLKRLANEKATAWHVSEYDQKQNENYEQYYQVVKDMIAKTDKPYAPWYEIENKDSKEAEEKLLAFIIHYLEQKIRERKSLSEMTARSAEKPADEKPSLTADAPSPDAPEARGKDWIPHLLQNVNPDKQMTKEEYNVQYKALSEKLSKYHNILYHKQIPVIIVFEGWDAGGKGGAIKRLTSKLDPRGYEVHPVAAPNAYEKSHNYLFRFWENVPKRGHIAIYDRSWYGRVMVERIEGFCSEEDWKRAYKEINEMEASWVKEGAIVLKFWLHIDKDEQERRFRERMDTPSKQWKITDEDWRNREKWDQYLEAVNEMIFRTSKETAPWIIVEGDCKYYARIKVMDSVTRAIEKRLKKE